MAEAFELVGEANRGEVSGAEAAAVLREMLGLVGLESVAEVEQEAGADAEELMAERERARAERDFERADAIRDRLTEMGWEVRDSAEGPRLVRR